MMVIRDFRLAALAHHNIRYALNLYNYQIINLIHRINYLIIVFLAFSRRMDAIMTWKRYKCSARI